MSLFPKASRPQWPSWDKSKRRASSAGPCISKPGKTIEQSSTTNHQDVTKTGSALPPAPKAAVSSTASKAAPSDLKRPPSGRRSSVDAAAHVTFVEDAEDELRTSTAVPPQHDEHAVDDHGTHPKDHSVHWSQLKKPRKKGLLEQAITQMSEIKTDDAIKRLTKEDAEEKLKAAKLMSSVAGHIVGAMQDSANRVPIRTAKSMKRDDAIEKLTRVMVEAELAEQAKKEEEEEEQEGWEMLAFEQSPARQRERNEGYVVITQQRKTSCPAAPRRERKGKHPLDLIRVLEMRPDTPPPPKVRACSVEHETHRECITVHAADFQKYGTDVKMLRALKVDPPPSNEPATVQASVDAPVQDEVAKAHVEEEPFVFTWEGKDITRARITQNDTGINEVWFPPSPQKGGGGSQSSTRAPSTESAFDRLFRQGLQRSTNDGNQSRSRHGSGNGTANSQTPHSRGQSKERSRPNSRPPYKDSCESRPSSRPPSKQSRIPGSRPPSARESRPSSARPYGDNVQSTLPALPLPSLPQKV